jgi:Flp pilus assembly pilin Flp
MSRDKDLTWFGGRRRPSGWRLIPSHSWGADPGKEEGMYTAMKRLVRDESGQDLAEYAIALAVITLAVIAAVQLVGTRVGTLWNNAATTLQNAAS